MLVKTRVRSIPIKSGCGKKINEKYSSEGGFHPKILWRVRSDEKRTDCRNNMTMLTLSQTVLLGSVRTRETLLDASCRTKIGESVVNIFCTIVTLEIFYGPLKSSLNESNKVLKMCQYFIFTAHGVYPSITRVLICEKDIIFKSTTRQNRGLPNIAMYDKEKRRGTFFIGRKR